MDRTSQTSDLISNLPHNAIGDILMRLPLKEAVKTSVLSKTWRYKWATVPQLVFDNNNLGPRNYLKGTSNQPFMIIYQILMVHYLPILKCTLSISGMESCPGIDHLVSFLTTRDLEELAIKIWRGKPHKLPPHLFYCLKLRHLSLHRCILIQPPPTFRGFNMLQCIEFYETELGTDFSESFITKCPLLERLKLHRCSELDVLSLDAPSLKFLDFAGNDTLFIFTNTPLLEKVSIQQTESHLSLHHFLDLFSCLQLRYLSLHRCIFISPPPTFRGFYKLLCIEFYEIELDADFYESFISKCPLLEILTLHNCTKLDALSLDAPKLKFLDFAGCDTLVKFNNTPLLETVLIQYIGDLVSEFFGFIAGWLNALSSLPALELLQLGHLPIPSSIGSVELPSDLNTSTLVLPKLWSKPHTQSMINFVHSLIRRCPNLRKLKIEGFSNIYNVEDDANAARQFQGQDFSDISFSRLQEVEILCSYGTNLEMEFVKLLLAKSPVLDRMCICHCEGRTAGQKLRVLVKAIQFQRASPRAEVLFCDPDSK